MFIYSLFEIEFIMAKLLDTLELCSLLFYNYETYSDNCS